MVQLRKKQFCATLARCLAFACLCAASAPPAWPQDIKRGAALYDNHCDICHEAHIHLGQGHKVKSLEELRRRISSWAEHSGQQWDDHDIADVLDYLNKSFYHFDEQAL